MKIGKYINKKFRLNIFSRSLFNDIADIYYTQKELDLPNDDIHVLIIQKIAKYIDEDEKALYDVIQDFYEHVERNMKNKKYYLASFDSDDVLLVETSYRFLRNITPEVVGFLASYMYYKDVVAIINNIERILREDNEQQDVLPQKYKLYIANKFYRLSFRNLVLHSILVNFFYVNKDIVKKKLLLTLYKIKTDIEHGKI